MITILPNPPTKTVTTEEFISNAKAFINNILKEYTMKKIDRKRYTKERNISGRQEVYDYWSHSSFSSGGSFGGGGASSSYSGYSSSSDSGSSGGGCD